jgi:hypothetical protein
MTKKTLNESLPPLQDIANQYGLNLSYLSDLKIAKAILAQGYKKPSIEIKNEE